MSELWQNLQVKLQSTYSCPSTTLKITAESPSVFSVLWAQGLLCFLGAPGEGP